jgi:hypothetical protein
MSILFWHLAVSIWLSAISLKSIDYFGQANCQKLTAESP